MDAFLVSNLVKKTLQAPKKYKLKRFKEHADFIAPNDSFTFGTPAASNGVVSAPVMPNAQAAQVAQADQSGDVYLTKVDVTNITEESHEDMVLNKKAERLSTTTFILMLLINSYAAYLSWECNSKNNYPLVLKLVFSLFAFMFGTLYIIYYILFRFDSCNTFVNPNSVF
jgi:hypothetical protein